MRPTPGSAQRYACDSATGASRIQSRSSGSPIARRIAWMRADLTFEMPPGRIASSISSSGASRTASQLVEALAQAQERDVAVAVVRRLRQDGQHELGERVAVRRLRPGTP